MTKSANIAWTVLHRTIAIRGSSGLRTQLYESILRLSTGIFLHRNKDHPCSARPATVG